MLAHARAARHGHSAAACLLRPLQTHDTSWDPASVKVTLNVALDGCIVPTSTGGARVDYAHLVVLDSFLDEPTRQGLLDAITAPGWQGPHPPESQWERRTADAAEAAPTWGLQGHVLAELAAGDLPAKLEVQSRLCKLYPGMLIAHMPSEHIQLGLQQQEQQTAAATAPAAAAAAAAAGFPQQEAPVSTQQLQQQPGQQQQQQPPQAQQAPQQQQAQQQQLQAQHPKQHAHRPQQQQQQQQPPDDADCAFMLANAAVYGDSFSWHVDADPQVFAEPSPWTQQYGLYCNREAGRPLFVSLLVYLDKEWPRANDAETLFLDTPTATGVFVRPKPYRVVLMDQDVAHRLSTPSAAANRPRYSLVWKLVMLPKAQAYSQQQQQRDTSAPVAACIARKEWGQPTYFGSAAHVLRMAKQSAAATAGAAVGQAAGVNGLDADAEVRAAKRQHM